MGITVIFFYQQLLLCIGSVRHISVEKFGFSTHFILERGVISSCYSCINDESVNCFRVLSLLLKSIDSAGSVEILENLEN